MTRDPAPSDIWLSPGVVLVPFGDTAAAFDLLSGTAHVLSEPAAWLCSASGRQEIDELLSSITPENDASAQSLEASIDKAIDALRDLGLLHRTAPFNPPQPPGPAGDPEHPGRHVGATHAVGVHRVAFRSDDPDLIKEIDRTLGDQVDEPPDEFFDAHRRASGGIDLVACDVWKFPNRESLIVQIPVVLNDHAARSHEVLVLHSGAVTTPDGATIALTGQADDGKSTLVAALLDAGCDYLGDESISFGNDLAPLGYPKPLTLDLRSRTLLDVPSEPFPHIGPEAIRPKVRRVHRTSRRIDAIVAVAYRQSHPLSPQLLDPVNALEVLCSNALNLARAGVDGLTTLCELATTTPVWQLSHPGIDSAAPWVLNLGRALDPPVG